MVHRQLLNRGDVHRQVRRPVGECHSARDARPRIEHGGGNRRVVFLHAFNKFFRRRVHVFRLDENLGRGAPTGHEPRNLLRFAEILNVVFQLQCQLVLVLRLFDVSSVEPLYVFAVERRFHRLDSFKERLHFLQVLIIQHAGFFRGLVRIIFEKIPASENQVIEVCQRNQLLNQR